MKYQYIWQDCFYCKGKRPKSRIDDPLFRDYNCFICKDQLGSFRKQPLIIDGGDYTINAVELKRAGIGISMSYSG